MKKREDCKGNLRSAQKFFRVMRIVLFVTFAFILQTRGSAFAQNQVVSLNLKKCNVEELLKEIKKQTGLRFMYKSAFINDVPRFDVNVKERRVDQVLDEVFRDTPIGYYYENGVIILVKKGAPEDKKEVAKKVLKGKVVDEKGEALIGATVLLKGTNIGVAADTAGRFTLTLPQGKQQVLLFSFLGMKTREFNVDQIKDFQKMLIIKLEPDASEVDEIVVTGYGNLRKASFTGKAITVSGEDLKKVATRNIISALQVFDPSLRIKENNQFGSDPNALPEFNIRGNSSIGITGLEQVENMNKANLKNNTNLPLFIMDGFEVSVEKVYDMDMGRVESVNILKDAAATAMYGSRAANGVIVITTVKPKVGEVQVRYNFLGTLTMPDLTDYNLMNSTEKLEAERLAGLYIAEKPNDQIVLEKEYYEKLALIQKGVDTDWLSQPLRNAFNHKHTLYVEGGAGEAMRFGLDFKYDKNKGVMKGSFRDVKSVGFDVEYQLKQFQVRNTISYGIMNSEESPYGYFSLYSRKQPYDIFKDENGEYLLKTNERLFNDENPLYDAQLSNYDRSNYNELIDNLNLNWNIVQGIQLRATFSVTMRDGSSAKFVSPESSTYTIDEDPGERGSLSLVDDKTVSFDGNCVFYLYKAINNEHFINLNLGVNARQSSYRRLQSDYKGFPLGTMDNITYARKIERKPNQEEQTTRLFGYIGALNYSYKDIYLFDVSGRLDGSSEFGVNNKFAPFWAVGLGLNMHQYEFLKDSSWLSKLKLRGSIGSLGKVNFPAYAAMTQYEPYKDDWYSTGSASKLVYLGNPDLKWEITKTTDAGVEVGFWNDRLTGEFSYYKKKTQDLITVVTIPTSAGFSQYRDNMGEVINEGFEIDIRGKVLQSKDMTLMVFGNLGHNKNKIGKISASLREYNSKVEELLNKVKKLDTDEVRYEPIARYIEGGSTTSIFAMRSAGIDPANGKEKFIRRDGTTTYDYDAKDEVIVGDLLPDIQGSFGLNMYYKGFSLYMTFMYEVGAQKYNSTLVNAVENADIEFNNVDQRVLFDRWIKPGDLTPLKDIKDRENTTKPTSRFVQDDNWLSLSNFSIGYDLPKALLKQTRVTQCNFQLSTSNAFRWSSIKRERGLSYPYARSYDLTMNLIF